MAACNLTIQLDDPHTPRRGGESVSGTVVVTCTDGVTCDRLELTSAWSTHGRGNVESGTVDSTVVYQGKWDANREYRYPFTLKSAAWPPTYYGTYLNVGQFVRARAHAPWSTDVKAEVEFPVVADSAPDDLKPPVAPAKKSAKIIGWTIGIILLAVFGTMFGILLLFLLPFAAIVGAGYWLIRVFLPRRVTGLVECTVDPLRLERGETVRGRMRFTPRKNVPINGILWSLKCQEKCVSGSGSNRTTHLHEVFQTGQRLAEATRLSAGMPLSHEFEFAIPGNAPVSLKFTNNELLWSGEVRIDIPNWPDWVHKFTVTVVPSAQAAGSAPPPILRSGFVSNSADGGGKSRLPTPEEEAWFHEILQQVGQSHGDLARLRTVLEAVRDNEFVIRVDIDGFRERPSSVPNAEPGKWMSAHVTARDVEVGLHFPAPQECPNEGTYNWCGAARMIGYDSELDCVLLRAL